MFPEGHFQQQGCASRNLAEDREGPGGRGKVQGCSWALLLPREEENHIEADTWPAHLKFRVELMGSFVLLYISDVPHSVWLP